MRIKQVKQLYWPLFVDYVNNSVSNHTVYKRVILIDASKLPKCTTVMLEYKVANTGLHENNPKSAKSTKVLNIKL